MTTQTKPPGRPLKLDDAMITALSEYVSKGNYYHDACEICGIDPSTLYLWTKQAEQDFKDGLETDFTRLSIALKSARAKARSEFVEVIREAAVVKREWLPAITYLERTDPDHWGRKDRVRVDSHETKEITVTHVEIVLNDSRQSQVIEGESRELLPEGKE